MYLNPLLFKYKKMQICNFLFYSILKAKSLQILPILKLILHLHKQVYLQAIVIVTLPNIGVIFLSQGLLLTGYLVYMKLTNQPINPKQKTDQLNRHQREKEKQQMVSASQSNLSNLNSLTKTFYQQPEAK